MSEPSDAVTCTLCPHHCQLREGQRGFCRARRQQHGKIVAENYGVLTSVAVDPIEKKPLYHFHPGSRILSVGSYGCNLRCPFCQNYEISQYGSEAFAGRAMKVMPEMLLQLAQKARQAYGSIGVAFTYNEPLVGYEFVRDAAKILQAHGELVVLVTNGQIEAEPWQELLPYIDAANIDLKGFSAEFYRWLGGDFATTRNAIEMAVQAGVHVEVTTLVIPGRNDSDAEMEKEASYLASLDENLPLHLSRYFPRYQLDVPMTPAATLYRLQEIAGKYLKYVHLGNI